MAQRTDLLIVGGGIIGSSLAWALAERGHRDITVLDLDLAGVYASSELNAGGARATWWQPVNIESCRATLDFFDRHRERFGFRRCGYLWLYGDPDLYREALERRALQNRSGLAVEALSRGDVCERFPLVDRHSEEIVGATFSPRDGLVNPNAVRSHFRSEAEARGVHFRNRDFVVGVATATRSGHGGASRFVQAVDVAELDLGRAGAAEPRLREILTTHHAPRDLTLREMRIEADVVVNCLGAWSPIFSSKIGVQDVSRPVRRQISLVDVRVEDIPALEGDPTAWQAMGMLVDTSGLYLHPEGAHWLAGYSTPDEAPGYDFDYEGESFFVEEIWPRLAHRSSAFERCGHVRGWAGLYSVTPDRSGIAGAVSGFANLFEAHSFTGRGVMQSWAVGQAMAELVSTGRFDTIDLSPLSGDRFDDPARWVREPLHI